MSANSTLQFELKGVPELEARLRRLRDSVAQRVVVKAVGAAAKPIVEAAARNARMTSARHGQRLGGLSKSMGVVVRNYRATQRVLAVIGPLMNKTYRRLGQKEVPANIAHLIEFGHRIALGGTLTRTQKEGWTPETVYDPKRQTMVFKRGAPRRAGKSKRTGLAGEGRVGGTVPAYPFLRPAWDSGKSTAQNVLEDELRAGIEAEAAK